MPTNQYFLAHEKKLGKVFQAEQLFQSGYGIYQSGDYRSSKAKFEEAIMLNPRHIAAHYYKASCLQNQSLFQDAIQFYNNTLALDPKHAGALQQRGNCYRALGQLTQGLKDLDLSIQIDPDVLYSYYIRSLIHFSLGNYQQANTDFVKAKPYMPTNQYFLAHEKKLGKVFQAEKVFQSGYKIYQSGDYRGAKAQFEEAIMLNPRHVAAHYYKASCLQNQSLFQDAIQFYNNTLALDPKHAGALQQRGNCYRALGQLTQGLKDLDLSIQIDPDVLYSYYIRSLIHFSLGNYQQASSDLVKAKPSMPTNQYFLAHEKKLGKVFQAEQLFQSGYGIYQSGDYRSSKAKFEEAIMLNPRHIAAHYYKASCLQNQSLFQDAIQFYNNTLALDPKHAGALQQRGNCYRALGQLTQGLKDLDLSIQIDPDVLYSYYIRSLIHFSLGNYQQASSDLVKAKPSMPTNQYFLAHENKLQQVLEAEKIFQKAINCQPMVTFFGLNFSQKLGLLNQAISISPDHAMAHYYKGALLYQQNNFQDAIHSYSQTITLNPEYYGALGQRGECYRAISQHANALVDLDKALTLQPNYAYGYYLRSLVHYELGNFGHALIDMEFAKPAVQMDPQNIYYLKHQTNLKNYFGSGYYDCTSKIATARQSYKREKISLRSGLGVSSGESIEGCYGNTDKEIAKGGPAHVCKILKTDSDVCAIAKSEWNHAFKSAMSESSYSGFSAGIDSFGMASRLSRATTDLNKHCRSERESFARNRAEYSTGGKFSFRGACDRLNRESKGNRSRRP